MTPTPLVSTWTRSAPRPRKTGRLAPAPKNVVETPGWRSNVSPKDPAKVSKISSRSSAVALPINSSAVRSGPGVLTMMTGSRSSSPPCAMAAGIRANVEIEARRRTRDMEILVLCYHLHGFSNASPQISKLKCRSNMKERPPLLESRSVLSLASGRSPDRGKG